MADQTRTIYQCPSPPHHDIAAMMEKSKAAAIQLGYHSSTVHDVKVINSLNFTTSTDEQYNPAFIELAHEKKPDWTQEQVITHIKQHSDRAMESGIVYDTTLNLMVVNQNSFNITVKSPKSMQVLVNHEMGHVLTRDQLVNYGINAQECQAAEIAATVLGAQLSGQQARSLAHGVNADKAYQAGVQSFIDSYFCVVKTADSTHGTPYQSAVAIAQDNPGMKLHFPSSIPHEAWNNNVNPTFPDGYAVPVTPGDPGDPVVASAAAWVTTTRSVANPKNSVHPPHTQKTLSLCPHAQQLTQEARDCLQAAGIGNESPNVTDYVAPVIGMLKQTTQKTPG